MRLILISGLSGSGKSVALRALEDSGFYCVDNLPATMLPEAMSLYADFGYEQIAISVDTRSGPSLGALPDAVARMRAQNIDVRLLFLEARTETLVKRFSETRRRHPLSGAGITVEESIRLEQEMLAEVPELGTRIDTSELSANALRSWVRELVDADGSRLMLIFESFGFKHGLPQDADFVFDARCLPNPYYDPQLRPFTGRDQPIIDFFAKHGEVAEMIADIEAMVAKWLPCYGKENRSYLTVAVGCTGGQHRSVYIIENLARAFADRQVLVRHRQLYREP
ncbi:RNase adapter RapZ [Chromobacterium subtsugae]|uniref:RNase adapter RapZ n=1 Tax=Chromobacterium subtsugae TaxID=251747 RepID=A0ABS7FCK4_9NEIS|nr:MULTISPECIES: RNase adapter RapZ [Chromobacterium]KUM05690.1 nucleotide-binding protein [Chromobacterium subtsugae]KZE87148.1 RNase adaptor protein RapZ [Chromobacterium sp. F49]MBW7565907.1 RNase adapter RapZ [Chromobacterium subtsugae]MBW8287053.1 RNase adapter RapZ [Chromobacterium subtsugae]OBU88179.1 nucleotide-binding protein [Chromobacterium subtsugae]